MPPKDIVPTPTHDVNGRLDGETAKPAETTTPDGRNLFDPAYLGLPQDFAAVIDAAKTQAVIKVTKPEPEWVFRVHSEHRLMAMLLVLRDGTYMVAPNMWASLTGMKLCKKYILLACVTKGGTAFLWPIIMPPENGREWNTWPRSAWHIAEQAKERWCRVESDQEASCYVVTPDKRPLDQQAKPNWPDLTFEQWLELAFKDHMITSLDHPVLKHLRLED
jgi:hypothetical protein